MDKILDWGAQFALVALDTTRRIIEYLPQIFGVLLLLLVGWLVALLGRMIVVRLIRGLNQIRSRVQIAGTAILPNISEPFAQVIARVVFWIIILIFVALSTDLLGLGMFADWLSRLVNHLPNILSGVLIIWAGVVFSGLVAQTVRTAAINLAESQRIALARIAQIFTLVMLILIGVDQIGVNVSVVVTIVSITIGAALGGLAIAFSLGARQLVSNLIGVRYLNSDYRLGERVRIGDYEGTVLEISSVAVILDTAQGRVTIPARLFSEQPSVLVAEGKTDV